MTTFTTSLPSPVLSVKDLVVEFRTERGILRAVDKVSFDLNAGQMLGLVGESGCGKSVTSLAILGLIPAPQGRIVSGSIRLLGQELVGLSNRDLRMLRGSEISMIFQDPMTALNPVLSVGNQMSDVITQHQSLSRKKARIRAIEMLEIVGIPSPDKRIDEYPHQLSGGMRQRVMIAMAMSCGPKVLLADEPTTALDVTTQAQVLEEMKRLQNQFGMSVILVTHDLGVVYETCDSVMVMYCGQIVERASANNLFSGPRHPYAKGLLESVPKIRSTKVSKLPVIEGMVPDMMELGVGCRFSDRCPRVIDQCRIEMPRLRPIGGSEAACFNPEPGEGR